MFHVGLVSVTNGLNPISTRPIWLSLGAGVAFVIATFGLYAAFQRGPVRLVAPLIAAYPILSVAWAQWSGGSVTLLQWVAVLVIVIGVGAVAALSDTAVDDSPSKGRTAAYALIAAVGFAATFALGQGAADLSDKGTSTLITRVLAMALTIAILLLTKSAFWPGLRALPFLIAMGIADGIALLCVLSAGQLTNPQYAAVASSMFGMLTIIMAWAFLREKMTPLQWAGCALAFAGVGYLAS